LLSRYNEEVNRKMNSFIEKLTRDQWERKFGGYFNSISRLCNHIYICDFNWLKRFSSLRPFEFVKKDLFRSNIAFTGLAVKNAKDYLAKRLELDDEINTFVTELTDKDLLENLKYVDSHGIEHYRNFGGLVIHMFNHGTHHRGMISLYLEEMGIENDYSNLMDIV